MRVFESEGIKIFNNDCMDVMKYMPTGEVDITFTSPPFKEEDVDGDYWDTYELWMKEILRVTSKVAIIIHSATKLNEVISKYPPKRTLVWGKGIIMASYRWNPIHVYQISDSYKVNKYIWADTFGVESILGKWKVHKYQDPEILYTAILKMFKGCKHVFDPFMGSGTTGKSCKELGLTFWGCEIDKENFKVAKSVLVDNDSVA